MAESNSSSGGMGFVRWLTILFIGLKLTHYIEWTWWWVLSPIWISLVLFCLMMMGVGFVAFILYLKDKARQSPTHLDRREAIRRAMRDMR